ncbi:DUF1015 family protein [Enterococcus asini]|uniref:DUF1015 domain-containing protein n=1 Tax=Enterococcus asini TaxID=57732 RepID=UPI001E4BE405|nr:DUF1015 family protein [Enterococcus asini]MCD5027835.1 DUF1015 domain-containing protein [Enterococcus asini]MDT2743663.1 DUF1015 family protein [Enterococcus asini]MDT2763682.1 DUF1015 family protein [Enterococcus asini]MDT2784071.1 DUF1015 family protein [Enterococcus asini]
MVQVRPFPGIRPAAELAAQVACLPYDVVNSTEAQALAADNPYSFFHIDKAEIDLPHDLSPYDPQVYQKAAENFQDFLAKGWLVKEQQPLLYLYELTMNGRSQTGLVATTSIDDYTSGKIKKHEFTRPEKEVDRIKHIQACDANTSPIFLSYRDEDHIQRLISQWQDQKAPVYDFTSYHEVQHRVWVIDDSAIIADLTAAFDEVPALYIADGHHRTESAVKVGLEKRANGEQSSESDYFLSIIFPESQLAIWEYNRVLNVDLPEDFFSQLEQAFDVAVSGVKKPVAQGQIQLYLDSKWYTLTIKEAVIPTDAVGRLDVSILQKQVFEKIFGIMDIRTDKRIDFIGGIRGPEELERLVDSGQWRLAFSMYPTQMEDLLAVADAGEIMPPKSTWFEPKLLSGLFLHDLETR